MLNKIAFTIVAKNYTGLAKVLADSVVQYDAGVKFYIFIADEESGSIELPDDAHTYLFANKALGISQREWEEMAFKYSITEFCTSIKPFCFNYLLSLESESNIIYFDPDILTFAPLDFVWQTLKTKEIIITPHILTCEIDFTGNFVEKNLLSSGIYNLGFIAIKKSQGTAAFISWWQKRLSNMCFDERNEGLFTDQKWIDFLPSFFTPDQLCISRHQGMNVAPWNFYERKITKEEDAFFVSNRIADSYEKDELLFVHFSGFNYRNLDHSNANIANLKVPPDLDAIFAAYNNLIASSKITSFLNLHYTYGTFTDGKPVVHYHRRLFRRLLEDKKEMPQPFNTEGPFYKLLKKHKLLVNEKFNIDKMNERNLEGFEKKLHTLNLLHKLLLRMLGAKNYFLFSKMMIRYHKPENQVFLLDKKYMKNNYKNEAL
jgi:hypothetical protein